MTAKKTNKKAAKKNDVEVIKVVEVDVEVQKAEAKAKRAKDAEATKVKRDAATNDIRLSDARCDQIRKLMNLIGDQNLGGGDIGIKYELKLDKIATKLDEMQKAMARDIYTEQHKGNDAEREAAKAAKIAEREAKKVARKDAMKSKLSAKLAELQAKLAELEAPVVA